MSRFRISVVMVLVAAGCGTAAPPSIPEKAPAPPAPITKEVAAAPKAPATPPAKGAATASPKAPTAPAPKLAAAKPAASAPLDLKSLEQRLKETSAIGVLTKLSLKNQVDDLITRFRAFHDGSRPPTLADLRPSYDLLIMKVLSLLQDHDQALAKDINASRDAIWGVLTDRQKLSTYL